MGTLSKKLRSLQGGRVAFLCPGCNDIHQVTVEGQSHPCWGYNGNPDSPTFTPSILVTWSEPSDVPEDFSDTSKDRRMVCHSFVTDGRIKFLTDCTHSLAGQTVDLPDVEQR